MFQLSLEDGRAYLSAAAISFVMRLCTIFLYKIGIELSIMSATSVGGPPSQYVPVAPRQLDPRNPVTIDTHPS